jgi:hypothetical protein
VKEGRKEGLSVIYHTHLKEGIKKGATVTLHLYSTKYKERQMKQTINEIYLGEI